MTHQLLFAIWFLLPAALANVAPIISNIIPGLKSWQTPLDDGRTWRGRELLGSHKTWRGLVCGIIVSTLVLWLQQSLFAHYAWVHQLAGNVNYVILPTLLLGPLFGLGALGGDALESLFKRQAGVASGQSWIPFDQLDYIIGGILVSLPFVRLSLVEYGWIIVIWFIMHIAASYVGWLFKLKAAPI